jgi:hypothetical protein
MMNFFKKQLLSHGLYRQIEILETMMKESAKYPSEEALYIWIQQLYVARVGTQNEGEFARDPLWSDIYAHHNSPLFQFLYQTFL